MKKSVKFKGDEGLVGVYTKDNLTIGKYYEVFEEAEIKDIGKVLTVENDTGNLGIYYEGLFE